MLNWLPALLLLLIQTTASPDWSGSWSQSALTRIQVASIVASVTDEQDAKLSCPAPVINASHSLDSSLELHAVRTGPARIPAEPTLFGAPCRAGPIVA